MPNLFSRQTKPYEVLSCVKLSKWEDVQRLPELFDGWLFRGQREASWFLKPTLERACARLRPGVTIAEVEQVVLRKFQERAAEYHQECPGPEDVLGWLSLLQHHGGPTRLLDFSESAHVAAFFALADAEGESAIWAVNTIRTLASQATRYIRLNPHSNSYTFPTFNDVFYGRFVWKGYGADITRPRNRKGRIAFQKGVFVYSFDMQHSLEENLYGIHGMDAERIREHAKRGYYTNMEQPRTIEALQESRVVKFMLPHSMRREGLRELRKMGIDYTELYRDLDGFARAMGHEVYDLTTDSELRGVGCLSPNRKNC